MPICSSVKPISSNKSLWLSLLLFLSPLFFYGQTLTGLWVGTVHNDSASVRKDQSFEIVLTEYKGKVFGYSRNEFIVNDTLYYIVKRVKGTIEGNTCEVKDDEIIAYNFRGKLDKGIKVTSTFRRSQSDSMWQLDGSWKTNKTRNYYSVAGKVTLGEEKDLTASKIFPHLEELKMADEVAFYKERKEEQSAPVVKIARPEKVQTEYTDKIPDHTTTDITVRKPELPAPVTVAPPVAVVTSKNEEVVKPALSETGNSQSAIAKTETKPVLSKVESPDESLEKKPALLQPGKTEQPGTKETAKPVATAANKTETQSSAVATSNDKPVLTAGGKTTQTAATTVPLKQSDKPAVVSSATQPGQTTGDKPVQTAGNTVETIAGKTGSNPKPAINPSAPVVTAAPEKSAVQETVAAAPVITNKSVAENPVPVTKPVIQPGNSNALIVKNAGEDPIKKSSVISGRKSEFTQEIQFRSDSLILTLYDNGEIDGDTVSVYLNGEVVMPSQGLKSSAIRKTIHLPHDLETFTLVMFAESLGKYPPNTGLLVIRDGNDVYNLRFSSDFSKSAGIVFRKRS